MQQNRNRGRFITIEGSEGVGKSTNLHFIEQWLQQQGVDPVLTREPGGTPLAEDIRALLLSQHGEPVSDTTELLLMFAARAQHVQQLIDPALAAGRWVLSDRFTDATYAYQGGGRGIDLSRIAELERWTLGVKEPDLTLLLDMPVADAMQRVQQRGALDRFEQEKIEFFERVRHVYLERAAAHPQRFVVIDAAQPLTDVQQHIAQALQAFNQTFSVQHDG